MITLFTLTIFLTISYTIKHLREVYINHYRNTNSLGLKFLQLRTLHVQGLANVDKKGEYFKNELNEYLNATGGSIVAMTLIPNYTELVKYEILRKELILMRRLITTQENMEKMYTFLVNITY
jgi:hypothetical protein